MDRKQGDKSSQALASTRVPIQIKRQVVEPFRETSKDKSDKNSLEERRELRNGFVLKNPNNEMRPEDSCKINHKSKIEQIVRMFEHKSKIVCKDSSDCIESIRAPNSLFAGTQDQMRDKSRSQTQVSDSSTSTNSPSDKIYNIVKELLMTEEAYMTRLQLIDKNFRKHFLEKADPHERSYPNAKTIEDMFSSLSSIITFHSAFFLPELQNRINKWTDKSEIGDIFVKYGPHFKLYTIYINNYDNACANIMATCKKYPKFAQHMQDIEKKPDCQNLKLVHHMLEPIQRIPRYKLLITELVKKTPPDTPEFQNLEKALEIVSTSAKKANDRIRETQSAMKVLEIQNMFVDTIDIVTAGRFFIREGDLVRKQQKNGKSSSCHLFLFSDLIICCSKAGPSKYRKKASFDFASISLKNEANDDKQPNSFILYAANVPYIFIANSPEDKQAWIDSIKCAVYDYDGRTTSFLIRNSTVSMRESSAQNNHVLQSPISLYNNKSDKWVDKYIALTPEQKLIISSSSSPSTSENSYAVGEGLVSLVDLNNHTSRGISIEFPSMEETIQFTSKDDDLFVDRWYQILTTCSTRSRSKSQNCS